MMTEHKASGENIGPDDPVKLGAQPLPLGITPDKLRHTFASMRVASGKDPT
jgi:hypothetical protein